MRSDFTSHITSAEWRWVIFSASALVGLAILPFLWMLFHDVPGSQWEFMGVLHGYRDAAVDLSRIFQGKEGSWLTRYLHTPEPHDGTLVGLFYAFLGRVSYLTSLSPIVIFHIARCGAAMSMYLALYLLPASIWTKARPRLVFFGVAAVGSGFGWLLAPLTGETGFADLTGTNIFPFFSSLVNVHFPLTVACLALLASIVVIIFRPGGPEAPTVDNGGLSIFVLSLILAFVYPLALFPLALAFLACIGVQWYKDRVITRSHWHWFLWFSVPALPMTAYYIAVVKYNDVAGELWIKENSLPATSPLLLVLGLGFPLLLALPGIYRAVRRFEPDGDRFMLVWLAIIVLLIYLPTVFRQRFAIGIIIPLAYFATRATEDFWLNYIARRWRRHVFAAIIPIMAASHLFLLMLPLRPMTGDLNDVDFLLLQDDYLDAFSWLRRNADTGDIVLASPNVSLWIPAKTGLRVVYGHPRQTLDPGIKRRAVLRWYEETEANLCRPLLQGALTSGGDYTVRYVFVGPQERAGGEPACIHSLRLLMTFRRVRIYTYP